MLAWESGETAKKDRQRIAKKKKKKAKGNPRNGGLGVRKQMEEKGCHRGTL